MTADQRHLIWIPERGMVVLYPDGSGTLDDRQLSPGEIAEYKELIDTYQIVCTIPMKCFEDESDIS